MEERPTYLCNKCGKYFNHKIKLAVHKKYQHPKSASMSKISGNFDQTESGTVRPREMSTESKKPAELYLTTQETNVEIDGREVMQLSNESFQQVHEIPLHTSGSLSGDKSSPVLNDSHNYEVDQDRPQNQSQEGLIQNENGEPSIGTSPFSDPPSKDKDSKNVKRKRPDSDILREPQNKLLKISTATKFSEALPEEYCGRVETLSQNSRNKKHSKLQANSTERRFSCKFCEYRTNNSSDLRHHERTHTGENPYQCGSCDYTAKSMQAMTYHLKTHAGAKPFKCQYCDVSSSTAGNLRNHERTHTGEKPYKCKHCSYSASHSSTLRNHERTHTGEKPYKCQYCDYRSRTASSLQIHERLHTGEKPYQCGSCDYSAKTPGNMLRHVKTHTGERPYKCDICSYSTIQSANLQSHKRSHTGEKPYKCQYCDFSSTTSGNLRQHERTHTKGK